jgi:CheY-like chemotaxis protein
MIVILHVEDNSALGALVALTLGGLGFTGKTVGADTLAKSELLLAEAARKGELFDLIITDMHLPDGTGLDLVRHVREHPVWKGVPMLILSSDVDPKTVARAYALGANAYISKSTPGRSLNDVVTSLYHHWIEDVVMPHGDASDVRPMRATLRRSMNIRLRHANLYQKLAVRCADDVPESAFWLSRALAESNLINVLGLMQYQFADDAELDTSDADEISAAQTETEAKLSALELVLDNVQISRDDIYRRALELASIANVDLVARSMARAFPVVPAAISALRDFLVTNYERMSAWIDQHTRTPDVREDAKELRESAVENRAMS